MRGVDPAPDPEAPIIASSALVSGNRSRGPLDEGGDITLAPPLDKGCPLGTTSTFGIFLLGPTRVVDAAPEWEAAVVGRNAGGGGAGLAHAARASRRRGASVGAWR